MNGYVDQAFLIYPGMAHAVEVEVQDTVTEPGYDGFVWVRVLTETEPVKVHNSRLHTEDPKGRG